MLDNNKASDFVNELWDSSIIPEISEYIKVPNKSPSFDPDWESHGHMETAVAMLEAWCRKQPIKNMQVEIVRIAGRTPILFIDIPGQSDDVVLLYGHYDKQPEFSGWDDDLHPWTPVIKDGKLYGRGGADDGYATFGSLTAIRALQEQGIPHAHCIRDAYRPRQTTVGLTKFPFATHISPSRCGIITHGGAFAPTSLFFR